MNAWPSSSTFVCTCGLRPISRTSTRTRSGSRRHERSRIAATWPSCSRGWLVRLLDPAERLEHVAPRVAEDRLEHLVLRLEVVVEQAVRDARLLGDVADAARVVAAAREDADGGVEDLPPLLLLRD